MTISKHHGFTICTLPRNWKRAAAEGYTHHVTGNGCSMYGRNLEEARRLLAHTLQDRRMFDRHNRERIAMMARRQNRRR